MTRMWPFAVTSDPRNARVMSGALPYGNRVALEAVASGLRGAVGWPPISSSRRADAGFVRSAGAGRAQVVAP